MNQAEASFAPDAYPGVDFWHIEKKLELSITVLAEAETPEEEPANAVARALLDKNHPLGGWVEADSVWKEFLDDYFKAHPEAAEVWEDMCKALVEKTAGKAVVDGVTKGATELFTGIDETRMSKLISELGLDKDVSD